MRHALVVLGLLAVVLLGACSDPDEPGADGGGGGADTPGSAMGPGISISDASSSNLDGPLLVNGFLVVRGGEARLCETLLESFPPQCGSPSLLVEGLDRDVIDGLTSEQGTTWSEQQIQLLGTVDGDTLTIAEGVSG